MSEELTKQLSQIQDELSKLVKTGQDEIQDVRTDCLTKTSEAIEAVKSDFSEKLKDYDEITKKLEAQEKAHKELEAYVARRNDAGNKISNENFYDQAKAEINEAFCKGMNKGWTPSEDVDKEVKKGVLREAMPDASDEELEAKMRTSDEVKTYLSGSNPNGGYWVTPDRSTRIIDRFFETSDMMRLATVETTLSDAWEVIVDDNELGANWVGEVDDRKDVKTNEIGLNTIVLHEINAPIPVSNKLMRNASFDIQSYITRKGADKISRTANTAFVKGDGNKKPRGFLDYPDWTTNGVYQRDALETVKSGTLGKFDADTIIKLQNSVKEVYQANAVFGTKRENFAEMIKLKGTDGHYLLDRTLLFNGAKMQMLGKPVEFMSDIDKFADNATALVYGDFKVGYTIIRRAGFMVTVDNLTRKNKNITLFWLESEFGGDVTNYESIKRYRLEA